MCVCVCLYVCMCVCVCVYVYYMVYSVCVQQPLKVLRKCNEYHKTTFPRREINEFTQCSFRYSITLSWLHRELLLYAMMLIYTSVLLFSVERGFSSEHNNIMLFACTTCSLPMSTAAGHAASMLCVLGSSWLSQA